MPFNQHSELAGKHAFLSASNYHWINYTDDKLVARYVTWKAAERGSALHEFAKMAIDLGVKLKETDQTLNAYVNDAIGFRMDTEQVLWYSSNCFGTADTISFRKKQLRIHDLKTGTNKCSMNQLMVYAALFCLEYRVNPGDIEIELRIYQNDNVDIYTPDTSEILHIMGRIQHFDNLIDITGAEVLS